MLALPPYIESSRNIGAPIRYAWDDDDIPTFYSERDDIQRTIARTTTAGAVAVGLGSLEWVAWRLPDGELRELLLNAIEAMWAGLIDLRHVTSLRHSPLALKRESCRGPERGVAYVAYKQLKDLRGCLEAAEPASPEASCTIRLARFVLPDRKPFEQWWRAVVERLVAEHPDSEEGPDDVGRPIPRQALVLDVPYRAVDDERLLRDQLKALDATTNPFLVR